MGLNNTLGVFLKELPGLESSLKNFDSRNPASHLSVSGRAIYDSKSSNPFQVAEHDSQPQRRNVFSDEADSNPFAGGNDTEELSSIEQPRGKPITKSDVERPIRYYSNQGQFHDYSDSSITSPNLSDNSFKPTQRGILLKKGTFDAPKTPVPKSKTPVEPKSGNSKGTAGNAEYGWSEAHNLSFNFEGKSQSIDEFQHSDSNSQQHQFSFCETTQFNEPQSQKNIQPLPNFGSYNRSNDANRSFEEPQFRGVETAEFSRPELYISVPMQANPPSQRKIRDSFSPSSIKAANASQSRMLIEQSQSHNRAGMSPNVEMMSVRSSRSMMYSKPHFEDHFIQVYAIVDIEMKSLIDYLKNSAFYLFKTKEPSELSNWEQRSSRNEQPQMIARKKPDNMRMKIFLFRDEQKGMLRDRYLITKEIKQTPTSTVFRCTNTKLDKDYAVKKIRDDRKAFETGINEVFFLSVMKEIGDPDKCNFLNVADYFYFNVCSPETPLHSLRTPRSFSRGPPTQNRPQNQRRNSRFLRPRRA